MREINRKTDERFLLIWAKRKSKSTAQQYERECTFLQKEVIYFTLNSIGNFAVYRSAYVGFS